MHNTGFFLSRFFPSFSNRRVHLDTVPRQIFGEIQEIQFSDSKIEVHVHLKNAFPGGIGNRRIMFVYNLWFASHPSSLSMGAALGLVLKERNPPNPRKKERNPNQKPKIPPQTFLQTGPGRVSTRQLSPPPVRGHRVLPRYSRRPHLPTDISMRDFRKFKNTTPKNSSGHVVYHTVLLGVGKETVWGFFCWVVYKVM